MWRTLLARSPDASSRSASSRTAPSMSGSSSWADHRSPRPPPARILPAPAPAMAACGGPRTPRPGGRRQRRLAVEWTVRWWPSEGALYTEPDGDRLLILERGAEGPVLVGAIERTCLAVRRLDARRVDG